MKISDKRLWLGIGISVTLVLFLLLGTDFRKLAEAFRQANYLYCVPMIGISLLGILVRSYRWKHIMAPMHRASLRNLFSATMIGFMAIDILPARLGEVVRAYLIGEKEGISKSGALATIVVERLFDIFIMLLLLAGVLFGMSLPGSHLEAIYVKTLQGAGVFIAVVFVFAVAFLILLVSKTDTALGLIQILLRPLPESWREKTLRLLRSFLSGLSVIRPGKHLFFIIAYSLVLWGLYALGNVFMFKAFRMDLPFLASFYILVVQAIAVAVPASPGFVGTYHAAVVAGLAAFQDDQAKNLGFAILSHFLIFLPVILYGLILLWKDHLSLRALEGAADRSREKPA